MNKKTQVMKIGIFAALFVVSLVVAGKADAAITTQLELGSKGNDVIELQQFLATNPLIYPAGTVSGYFGPLTKAAVTQFQVAYDISRAGRVGPVTMAKINDILASGLGLDVGGPAMSNLSLQTNRNGVTVSLATDELAQSQMFYDTQPLRLAEATKHAEQPYVSGIYTADNANVRNAHSLTVSGLQPNTIYYYLTRTVDRSGNVSMTMPNSFITNQ
jgi:peptidoglycan hydrolase-like protein with peptidoglycan-binding domain